VDILLLLPSVPSVKACGYINGKGGTFFIGGDAENATLNFSLRSGLNGTIR
jgi:hypothetical protein